MPDSSHRATIIAAVIAAVGTIAAAALTNWDKIFPPAQPPSSSGSPQVARADARPPAEPTPNIGGVWRDLNFPSNGSQITQRGGSFEFTRWGVLPSGIRFESSGNGTISGLRVTSTYSARYQSGAASTGSCSGTVSPDGTRMDLTCQDSLLGAFSAPAMRQ
jgi:hypothetical protein